MSDHLIAEANRHAKALPKMQLPTTHPTQRDIAWYVAECADLKEQLASEIEAKRKHLHIACEEINHLKVRVEFFEREIARLRADQLRIDWLEQSPDKRLNTIHDLWVNDGDIADIRAAIDAARKETKP